MSARFRSRRYRRDWALSSAFSTVGVLIGGQTRQRVIAVDGQPEVRPTMTLTLCGDHGVWDGRAAVRVLAAVKSELEGDGTKKKAPERREAFSTLNFPVCCRFSTYLRRFLRAAAAVCCQQRRARTEGEQRRRFRNLARNRDDDVRVVDRE